MRLHRLHVQAFGPFAGKHEIDFEELNDAGVFLITGSTGAGKSSVLDAICFALFGQVPGTRTTKTLQSHHAAAGIRPEVALEFSVGTRRFRVERVPEWQRAKRRGAGTTQEKGQARLAEMVDDGETQLSARAQEVGHFLSDLLGMTAGQFQQVAMLPQGEFQTFLHATSAGRQEVLQQLFGTERFLRIEDWFHDHVRELRDGAASGQAEARRLVDTLADRAGVPVPDFLQGDALVRSAVDDLLLPWAEQVVDRATTMAQAAAGRATTAAGDNADAESALSRASELIALAGRRDQALEILAKDADGSGEQLLRETVGADERAQRVLPVMALLAESQAAHAHAESALAAAATAAASTDPGSDLAIAQRRQQELEGLVTTEHELRLTQARLDDAERARARLEPDIGELRAKVARAPEGRTALEARRDELSGLASSQASLAGLVASARARAAAADLVPAAEASLEAARAAARDRRDDLADRREHHLAIVERRLAGMSAELASRLVDGEPCLVCGALSHPVPAAQSADAVDPATQEQARAEVESARAAHEAADAEAGRLATVLQSLLVAAEGRSPELAHGELAAAQTAQQVAIEAVESLARVDAEIERSRAEERQAQTRLIDAEREHASLVASISELGPSAVAAGELVTRARGQFASVAEALADAGDEAGRLTTHVHALSHALRCAEAVRRHRRAVATAATEAGFDDVDAVLAAILTDDLRVTHRVTLDGLVRLKAEAEFALAELDLEALTVDPPDLLVLEARALASRRELADAERDLHLCQERATVTSAQLSALRSALDGWTPHRDRFLVADSLARLVRGTGVDNELQMRLSAYVLARRLDQVLAAANVRLNSMREQRYSLQRSGEAARRGSQAGLGLVVVDEWTGESRDPMTLSGGETFVVSLALALGLSDVVAHESGGVQLDTLFIDEGFGMLDLDTLDDVMDRLDDLRAGGRTVGVISHVTELRSRIPTQLVVDKRTDGSSLRVTTLSA